MLDVSSLLPAVRRVLVLAAVVLPAALPLAPSSALAQAPSPVAGEASISTAGGYGRLIIRLATEVEAAARASGGVLIVRFKQPVSVAVNHLPSDAPDYFGAARRDPDGMALRFALRQKVKVSTLAAGERLFIDLLPESWTGEPPSLPREVVEELARRARDAERTAREQLALEQQRKRPPVRVRVATQPTFTRFIFDLPELTPVTVARGKDKLTLTFAKPLRFDLADAKLAMPESVSSIEAARDEDTAEVRFAFARHADVRTFREDSNYVVDVSPIETETPAVEGPPAVTAPQTVPSKAAPEAEEPAKPHAEAPEAPKSDAGGKTAGNAVAPPSPPPAVAAKEPAPAPPLSAAAPGKGRAVAAEVHRERDGLRLVFPFAEPVPAAMFRRADTLWLVFDTKTSVDVGALAGDPSKTIRSATAAAADGAQVVRIKLERPRLIGVEQQGAGWTVTVGDAKRGATRPLQVHRSVIGPGRTGIAIAFDKPGRQHRLNDPETGDTLLVVTGLGPVRGLPKGQDFVELRTLATAQGLAIVPVADDLEARLTADRVLLMRPGGLALSETAASKEEASRVLTFDTKRWKSNRRADYTKRQFDLVRAAAEAPPDRRLPRRLDLARFYLAHEMFAEAKAVLDTAIADERPAALTPAPLVLRAVAAIMLNHADDAMKDLANPIVGNRDDAPLWRAIAYSQQGKWAAARDAFRGAETTVGSLPPEFQRIALKDALQAAIEVGDITGAVGKLNDVEAVGVSAEIEPYVAVLAGRVAEGLGRTEDALASYHAAAESKVRPAAAQGRLRELALSYAQGKLKRADAIKELERLSVAWRGDETEVEALQLLERLYIEEGRYRDAFHAMKVALAARPGSAVTRSIHDVAGKAFEDLFIAGKADTLPAIEALSLFYDYRDLTPIGRRGDEMIRRLAERLAAVDLLDQAAELLQYQVDNRLQGAARAQVATRLAMIYLLDHKPDKAQAVLRATRMTDLADAIRIPRMLIEARALSDIGRHDFALEVIADIEGREAVRLRSDIYWASKRWQKAAEQIELLYGDRWKRFEPLSDAGRADILRAGVAYAMAEDKLGTARLRERYAPKMADGPDGQAFRLITSGVGPSSPEFREVAQVAASGSTLRSFLRDLMARYPLVQTASRGATEEPAAAPAPAKTESDPSPTGAVSRARPQRISAR
jgi:tetratricopeptide (TPR) repeat protein